MKRLIICSVILSLFTISGLNAQCRKKTPINKLQHEVALLQKCNINNREETEKSYECIIYDGLNRMVNVNFVKYGKEYYCYFGFLISNCPEYSFSISDPMEIYLSNNGKIQIFPCGDTKANYGFGVYSGETYSINCFYKIDRDDLEKLGKFEITHIEVYYTSKEMIAKSQKDENGRYFLEFKQKQGRWPRFLQKAANCMIGQD